MKKSIPLNHVSIFVLTAIFVLFGTQSLCAQDSLKVKNQTKTQKKYQGEADKKENKYRVETKKQSGSTEDQSKNEYGDQNQYRNEKDNGFIDEDGDGINDNVKKNKSQQEYQYRKEQKKTSKNQNKVKSGTSGNK